MIKINLFSLIGKISLDDKEFSKGIDNADKSFTKFSNNFKTVIGSVGKVGEAFGTGLSPKVLEAQTKIRELNLEVSKSSRYWGKNSEQALTAKRALTDYVLSLDDATFKQSFMKSQLGLTSRQLLDQASSIKINHRMTKLMGDQTQILTERMKGLAANGIKPDMLLPASTPGAFKILNETLAVSGKGIYGLSAGFRAFGNRIEKVTKGFALQKQVVKAANGDMVKYGLLMRGASAGLANLGLAFPVVGLASGLFYGKLISLATEGDKQTQKLADTFKNKLGKAFEPMLDMVNNLVQGFLKVGTSVADFMIKFNEAHPVIAKFIQGIALLTPAMTLLLLPLNLGLGLFRGWGVVIGSVSKLIMPFITSIGLASSTFLTLAGIIGVVAGAFTYFYNTNETFKNGVLAAWNLLKEGFHAVFDPIITYLTETLPAAFEAGGLSGVFTTLGNTFTQLLTYLYTNLPRFLEIGLQMIGNILNGIATNLPGILSKGTEIITNLLNGILAMMPSLIESAASIITSYAGYIANNLPIIIEKGVELLNALVEGISNNLPAIIDAAIKVIDALVNGLINNLPQIIDAGLKLLTAIVNGIINNLPKIIEAGLKIVIALVKALIQNAPKILEAGGKLLKSCVDGLIKGLPGVGKVGKDIVRGLWEGISGMGGWLWNKVSGFAGNILKTMKSALGIHSPSREAKKQIGKWIPPGITEGFEDQLPKMDEQIKSGMNDMIKSAANFDLSPINNNLNLASAVDIGSINPKGVSPLSTPQTTQTFNNTFTFNVEGDMSRDKMQEIADYVQEAIARNIRRDRMAIGQW